MAKEKEGRLEVIILSLSEVREMKDKLRNLREYLPRQEGSVYDLGVFLADRFSDDHELTPNVFLMRYSLALEELDKGLTPEEERKYAISRFPKELLGLLALYSSSIANAVTPKDFSLQVKEIEEAIEEERKKEVKVYGEEGIPEIKIPGVDPYELFKKEGKLPSCGILLRAEFFHKGNGVFTVYQYNNIERISIDEEGENKEHKYLYVNFGMDENSRQTYIGYEHPNYKYKNDEPYDRSVGSYIPCSFANLDLIDLSSGKLFGSAGRLLISKEAWHIGNLSARLDQHPMRDTLWGKHGQAVRLFEYGDFQGVAEAVKVIARDLIRLNPVAADLIREQIVRRLSQKEES